MKQMFGKSSDLAAPGRAAFLLEGDILLSFAASDIIAFMLTREEVIHVARLARLQLSEEEQEHFREQLSAILDYAKRLQDLDTTDVLPMVGVQLDQQTLREDTPWNGLTIEQVLENAPEHHQEQFKVPPILD